MSKSEIKFPLDLYYKERILTDITNQIEMIVFTISTFINLYSKEICDDHGEISIINLKMRRIIISLDNKIITFSFPYRLTIKDNKIYMLDNNDKKIDLVFLYSLKKVFEDFKDNTNNNTLEDIILEELDGNDIGLERYLNVIYGFIFYEYGYIRYEDDEERANADYHPRYHLDINFSDPSTYKIGLKKGINEKWLIELIDLTKKCKYIENRKKQ